MNADADASSEDGVVNDSGRVTTSRSILFLLLLLLSLQALGLKIMYLPLNRLIENRFCRDYYFEKDPSVIPSDGIVPEHLCKSDTVQQRLASLFGTIESLHLFIGLTYPFPLDSTC